MFEAAARLWREAPSRITGRCAVWNESLVHRDVVGSLLLWSSYVAISAMLAYALRHQWSKSPSLLKALYLLFAAFIFGCGQTHYLDVHTIFVPSSLTFAVNFKIAIGLISLATAVVLGAGVYGLEREGPAADTVFAAVVARVAVALRAWSGIVTAFAVLLALIVLTTVTTRKFVDTYQRRIAAGLVIRTSQRYLGVVVAAESGQRGYLLATTTGVDNTRYLLDYEEAARALPGVKAETGVKDRAVDDAVDAKMAELAYTVALARAGRVDEARRYVRNNTGFDLMREVRRRFVAAQAAADKELRARERDSQAVTVVAGTLLPLGGVSMLAVALLCFFSQRYEIDARRRAEADLATSVAALERSNADLEQFAYAASHDLQEPLRMVTSFSQLLANRYKGRLDEKADGWIERVVDGAKRMQAMIHDLLSYSRVTTKGVEPSAVGLDDVLAAAELNVAERVASSSAVVHVPAMMPAVLGDKTQLVLLFQNLLSNAVKYHAPGRPPVVNVSASVTRNRVVVAVSDNGVGIDPKFHEKVFEMFVRVGVSAEKGTGVGLALVRKIAERHGGSVRLESAPGVGSTFSVDLPLAEPNHAGV